MIETILKTVLCISSTICLWSSFLLAYDWQGVRQRRWLSLVLFLWGTAWSLRAYGLIFGESSHLYNEVLPPALILVGILAGFTFLVWPITVLRAPKVTTRQLLVFLLPFFLCVTLYFGIIGSFHLQQFSFISLGDLLTHISFFSVWFRFVMCACLLGYLVYTIKLIVSCVNRYNRYVEENYSEYEKYTITWVRGYLFGLVAITVFFFVNLCFASYATFMLHNVAACIFLAWLVSKVMVYNSPYVSERLRPASIESAIAKGEDFNSQFDLYKELIEMWMTTERPYLDSDFSLQKIMDRFRLNRTYASKIFNEGFGKSFLLVVRDYRIEYARELIKSNPTVAMSEIAHLCGYSTAQAFHKAFVYCNEGVTPGKYALMCARKE